MFPTSHTKLLKELRGQGAGAILKLYDRMRFRDLRDVAA